LTTHLICAQIERVQKTGRAETEWDTQLLAYADDVTILGEKITYRKTQ
jgi:hypothetical protein